MDVVDATRPGGSSACCGCNTPFGDEGGYVDVCARREVGSLTVTCNQEQQGCPWQGLLHDFEAHFAACPFSRVTCDLPGCTASVQRRHLAEHKVTECEGRHDACEHCGDDVIASGMSHHVAEECQQVAVPCANTCEATDLTRAKISEHLKVCPREKVRCYYATAGCHYNDERQALPAHHDNNVAYHLQMIHQIADAAKKAVSELRQANSALRQEVTEVKAENALLKELVSKPEARSEQRQANTAQDVTELKAENARLRSRVSELESSDEEVLKRMDSLEESQDATNQRLLVMQSAANRHPSPGGVDQVTVAGDVLPASQTSAAPPQTPEDCSTLKEKLEAVERAVTTQEWQITDLSIRQDLVEVKGSDGVFVWRISDVSRRITEAENGRTPSLYSPPFYSSPAGYKMCARIYLDGDGSGKSTHVSLFFVVMRGDFDALLPWPFQQRVKLSLVDQSAAGVSPQHHNVVESFRPDVTSSSFQRPTSDMNIATGCPRFALRSCLQSDRYVKDDTIFLKLEVSKSGLRSPDQRTIDLAAG